MENRIRNVKKAAAILSSFNFKDTTDCHVIVYYETRHSGISGVGKQSITLLPKEIGYLPVDDSYKAWNKKEWQNFVLEGANRIRGQGVIRVASIWICFSTESEENLAEDLFTKMYSIEITNFATGRFDRIVTSRLGGFYGVMLTKPESARIIGAADVVKLSNMIPSNRWQKAPNEYAKALNDSLVDTDKAFMCHQDI